MNWPFLFAGGIALLATLIHGIAGEYTDIRHLRASDVPLNEQAELRGAWHGFSVILALSALVLLLLAFGVVLEGSLVIARGLAIYYLACGVIFGLIVFFTRRDLLFRVPGWILLLAIAALTWWGTGYGG